MKKSILGSMVLLPLAMISLVSCNNIIKRDTTEEGSLSTPSISESIPQSENVEFENSFETPDINWSKNDTTPSISDTTTLLPTESTTIDDNAIKATKTTFTDSLKTNGPLTDNCVPSQGNVNLLVIPVNLKSSQRTDKVLNNIKTAFSGTEEETGWESLTTYYKKSSFGKLNFNVTVADWFTPTRPVTYYKNYVSTTRQEYGCNVILHEALAHYDSTYNYNDFDNDNDGYIDGIWLVYNYDVDYSGDSELFWAFVTWDERETLYDGVCANYFAWAGTDFMTKDYGYYDNSDLIIDTHTFIHETGHLMGLDDYYDYDTSTGASGGIYGADMMDYTMGDHNPASKMLLGWVSPTIISGVGQITLDLDAFATTGNFLLITNHKLTSVYDEYYLLEFYNATGLDAHDKPIQDYNGKSPLGIRLFHVDARKNMNNLGNINYNSGSYQCGYMYDNSDEDYKFIDVIPAVPTNYTTSTYKLFNANGLFVKDSSFGTTTTSMQKNKYHDGSDLNFSFVVNEVAQTKCNLTITMK